jgi:hypothetical protein
MVKIMKTLRFLTILIAVAVLFSPLARSTPEMSKKENRMCLTCHTAVGKSDLNDVGKCYKDHKFVLEGCEKKKQQ